MKELVLKNLVVHKKRNKVTAIIYTLTLASMIFLLVVANLQISIITDMNAYSDASFYIE